LNLDFFKVVGHAGVPEHDRCDELARGAITGRAR
jgi:ribonuclease HI